MQLRQMVMADAHELARARRGETGPAPETGGPGRREMWHEAMTQDGFRVLLLTRLRESVRRTHVPLANHLLRMVTRVLYGIEVGTEVTLGHGINFSHTVGTIIGGSSVIGDRVQFMGNNTVGTAKDNGYPIIEDDVVIGCGARILGPIRIGAGAVIGANAVVLVDVPAGSTATGIPATISDSTYKHPPITLVASSD